MSFKLLATEDFSRALKRLAKKYRSLKEDLTKLGVELSENPTLGTPIGADCYKVRLAISSKGKGKSGGARIITYIYVEAETVYLLSIYDKSEQANISDSRLKQLVKEIKRGE